MTETPTITIAPAPPPPATQVLMALRLGWNVSELRGRYREKLAEDREGPAARFDRGGNALPVREERTSPEIAIEVEKAVITLAKKLGMEIDGDALRERATAAREARDTAGWDAAWNALAGQIYKVDAFLQDGLYADTAAAAAAYQLGRVMADVTWCLDPTRTDGPASLRFLLGEERVELINLLLQRLLQFVDQITAYAISASVEEWATFVKADPRPPGEETVRVLRQQVGVWHDLLIDEVPWHTLIDPHDVVRERPSLGPLGPFTVELAISAASLAGLGLALWLVSVRGNGGAAAIATLLSAAGITGAGIRARIKDQAQNLLGQMRRAFDLELAEEVVRRPPPGAPARLPRHRRRGWHRAGSSPGAASFTRLGSRAAHR
jgi:hypothetical protein